MAPVTGVSTNPPPASPGRPPAPGVDQAAQARLEEGYARTPLAFEPNTGQADPGVRFQSRGAGFGFWLTSDEMVFSVPRHAPPGRDGGRDVFRLRLLGVNPDAETVGRDELASKSNYFLGADPAGWRTNVPHFGRVEVREAFPGVDLVLRGQVPGGRGFEYDFVVKPGASPDAVRLRWEGLEAVTEDAQGRLLLRTGGGTVVQDAPVLYQDGAGGRSPVAGRMVVRGPGEVGFEVTGAYDASKPLVLDPAISFATYLGGSGSDKAYGVAVDAAGNSYVVGQTSSNNFPTQDGYQTTGPFVPDAFVTKLNAAGDGLAYSTFLGGSLTDGGYAIAVDPSGSAYVTGVAGSGFPTTAGAYQW